MTLRTALEIFSNPHDLQVTLTRSDGKYGVAITRGPIDNFKTILSGPPRFRSRKQVIQIVHDALTDAYKTGIEKVGRRSYWLTRDQIKKIEQELQSSDTVKTFC